MNHNSSSQPHFLTEEGTLVIKGSPPIPAQFSHMPRWLTKALGQESGEIADKKTLIHIRHGKTFANAANRIA